MKFLEFDDMLAILPAEAKTLSAAESKLLPLFERVKGDSQRLARLTKEGKLSTFQVNSQGRAVAVVWYRTEAERLIVDTLVAIVNDVETLPIATKAMEKVAAAHGCNVLEGTTARAGLARELQAMDWYPVGITLRKDF